MPVVRSVVAQLQEDIAHESTLNMALSPTEQVLLTLRFVSALWLFKYEL